MSTTCRQPGLFSIQSLCESCPQIGVNFKWIHSCFPEGNRITIQILPSLSRWSSSPSRTLLNHTRNRGVKINLQQHSTLKLGDVNYLVFLCGVCAFVTNNYGQWSWDTPNTVTLFLFYTKHGFLFCSLSHFLFTIASYLLLFLTVFTITAFIIGEGFFKRLCALLFHYHAQPFH